jgi:hypothetical protein
MRAHRSDRVLSALLATGIALTLGLHLGCELDPPAVREFNLYVEENLCTDRYDTECLETITHHVCASGCPRTGYSMRWIVPGRVDIHLTLPLLRKLRNAAAQHPTLETRHSLGMSLEDLVYSQIQMFLNDPSARFYNEYRRPLDLSKVRSRNTVDPALFDSVTWVNEGGSPHAMVQADMALWLVSMAKSWAVFGHPERVDEHLRLSERVFRSFGIPHDAGGVRNNRPGNRCYMDLYCYWFHSFPVGSEPYPMTVLNQHLHAVRDALVAHQQLSEWRDEGIADVNGEIHPLPLEFASPHIEQLREWGRGGLFQLAFGPGNEVIKDAPPNLAEFLAPEDIVDHDQRYRAHYRYNIGAGPSDISPEKNCHYHYHSVKVMADILELISGSLFSSDPDFVEIYYGLLYDRSEGDTRTCNNRGYIPSSKRVMNGVPLAELFMGSVVEQGFQANCTKDEPEQFRNGTDDFEAAATFYDGAYAECLF